MQRGASALVVEREAERGGRRLGAARVDALHEVRGLPLPARIEDGVGVKEQQPGMLGARRPGNELAAAAWARSEHLCAGRVGDLAGAVLGAAVDEDHLADEPLDGGGDQRRQRVGQAGLCVEGWDHHRDHGLSLPRRGDAQQPAMQDGPSVRPLGSCFVLALHIVFA